MTATEPELGYLHELFPRASDGLLGLLSAAAEHAGLVLADFQSLRDLVTLPGYDDSESVHVLLLLLLVALEEGSLCIELSDAGLRRRLADFVGEEQARAWSQRILSDVEGDAFPELIGSTCEDQRPVIQRRIGVRRFLYFQKYLHHELIFRSDLESRLSAAASADTCSVSDWPRILGEVLEVHPLSIDNRPLRLDVQQRRALERALVNRLTIVSGGPGTGKTSIVLTLLRCLVRAGIAVERIALAAPTGRAAQRLSDAIRGGLAGLPAACRDAPPDKLLEQVAANTLHHLLRYNPARGSFGHHAENPVAADVVIVDEVSMVGVALMAQLLQALRPDTRLVLLGDKDQLPSVEAGAVLGGLVDELGAERGCVVILEQNYRSQPGIREAAQAINRQDTGVIERLPVLSLTSQPMAGGSERSVQRLQDAEAGVWFLPIGPNPLAGLRRLLMAWAEQQYRTPAGGVAAYEELIRRADGALAGGEETGPIRKVLDELFRVLGQGRLLTVLREGPWGCGGINEFFEQHLRPRWGKNRRRDLFAGAPVLITRNDHGRQLYNGDVGIALYGHSGGLRAVFPRGDGYESFPADTLPAHELGFALTVHKSQGSEYGRVLLVVPPEGGRRLLTKEIIYTGITRAKNLALLCGTKEALQFAIGRRIVRESGINAFPAV